MKFTIYINIIRRGLPLPFHKKYWTSVSLVIKAVITTLLTWTYITLFCFVDYIVYKVAFEIEGGIGSETGETKSGCGKEGKHIFCPL